MSESSSLKSHEQHLATLATVLRVEREIGLPEGALRLEGGWEGLLAALAHFNPRTVFVCRYALEEEDFLLSSNDAGIELLESDLRLDTLHRPLKAFRKYIGELLHLEVLFHSEGERLSTWLDAPWTGEYEAAREAALLVWSEQQSLERQVQGQVNREKHALELTYARQVLLDYPPFVKAAKIMKTSWSVLEDLAESKSEALKLEHLSLERLVRQVTTELRYGVE